MAWSDYNDDRVRVGDAISCPAYYADYTSGATPGTTLVSMDDTVWVIYRYDPFTVRDDGTDSSLVYVASNISSRNAVAVLPNYYGTTPPFITPPVASPAGDNRNGWDITSSVPLDFSTGDRNTTLEITQGTNAVPGFYVAEFYQNCTVNDPSRGTVSTSVVVTSRRLYGVGYYNVAWIIGMDYTVSPTAITIPYGTTGASSTIQITGDPPLCADTIDLVSYDGILTVVTGTVPSYDQYLAFNAATINRRLTNSASAYFYVGSGAEPGHTYTFTVRLNSNDYSLAGNAAKAATGNGFIGAPPSGGLPALDEDYAPNSLLFDQGDITVSVTIGPATGGGSGGGSGSSPSCNYCAIDALLRPTFAMLDLSGSPPEICILSTLDAGHSFLLTRTGLHGYDPSLLINRQTNTLRLIWSNGTGTIYQSWSADMGQTWTAAAAITDAANNSFPYAVLHPTNNRLAVMAGLGTDDKIRLYRSQDGGRTFTQSGFGSIVSGVSLTTPGRPVLAWVGSVLIFAYGTGSGQVKTYYSLNLTGFTAAGTINSPLVGLTIWSHRGVLYLAGANGSNVEVWISLDVGRTWSHLMTTTITLDVNNIAIGEWPQTGNLVLGTGYYSDDGGQTWTPD